MQKAIGPILKALACVVLCFFVIGIIMLTNFLRANYVPALYHAPLYFGLALTGLTLSALLFAAGQSVQSLARSAELQSAACGALRDLLAFLRSQTAPNPFSAYEGFGGSCSVEPAAGWRRPTGRGDEPMPPGQPPLREADLRPAASLPESPPPEAVPDPAPRQVACSLCGTIQEAGGAACRHCGASFTGACPA